MSILPERQGDYQISTSEALYDPEWDDFVLHHPEPHHEQTSMWADLRHNYGWHPIRLLMRRENQIVAGLQILEHRIARIFRVGYLPRGPLLLEGVDECVLIDSLKHLIQKHRLVYLAISLPYYSHSFARQLLDKGFLLRPDRLPPNVWTKATVMIDLSQDLATVYSKMWSTKRQGIRIGQRAGISVRFGDERDIPAFYHLLMELCNRRKAKCNIPDVNFLYMLWNSLAPFGRCKILVAEKESEVVCAMILITIGKWARVWRIGWSGNYAKYAPNIILYWEAIRWAKENGFHFFDFIGIDIDDAKALLSGRHKSAPFKCQITFFKISFGGDIFILPGEYCYFPHPILNFFFKTMGRTLLENQIIQRLTSFLLTRSNQKK